ncbi:hypothetical protein ACSBR1_030378 [Camellia fascicularis]
MEFFRSLWSRDDRVPIGSRTRRKIKFQHFSAWASGAETELALSIFLPESN